LEKQTAHFLEIKSKGKEKGKECAQKSIMNFIVYLKLPLIRITVIIIFKNQWRGCLGLEDTYPLLIEDMPKSKNLLVIP
jgi:hypothetical protein